jgi:hypothetical protein
MPWLVFSPTSKIIDYSVIQRKRAADIFNPVVGDNAAHGKKFIKYQNPMGGREKLYKSMVEFVIRKYGLPK